MDVFVADSSVRDLHQGHSFLSHGKLIEDAKKQSGSRHCKSGRPPELILGTSTMLTSFVLGGLVIST
jgi:hypothetical protein